MSGLPRLHPQETALLSHMHSPSTVRACLGWHASTDRQVVLVMNLCFAFSKPFLAAKQDKAVETGSSNLKTLSLTGLLYNRQGED